MTTGATHVLSAAHVSTGTRAADHKTLTHQAQREIEHLTDHLFLDQNGLQRRSILMADLGNARTSSLWLATGVASALGKILRQQVRVISVGSASADILSALENNAPNSDDGLCILEHTGDATFRSNTTEEVPDRVSALQADGNCVIVHVVSFDDSIGTLVRRTPLDGVVLLIRAGRTHRAAIGAIERQLLAAGTPILGSVLLDRVYPIPEKLYRLL